MGAFGGGGGDAERGEYAEVLECGGDGGDADVDGGVGS